MLGHIFVCMHWQNHKVHMFFFLFIQKTVIRLFCSLLEILLISTRTVHTQHISYLDGLIYFPNIFKNTEKDHLTLFFSIFHSFCNLYDVFKTDRWVVDFEFKTNAFQNCRIFDCVPIVFVLIN